MLGQIDRYSETIFATPDRKNCDDCEQNAATRDRLLSGVVPHISDLAAAIARIYSL
jgi:hypothetical protein